MTGSATREPVRYPGHWLWGIGPDLANQPLEVLTRLGAAGDVVRTRIGPFPAFVLNRPEHIQRVLQEPRLYDKQTLSYGRIRLLLGNGLITSDGDFWRRQRRIAQPAFHKQRIAGFADVMARAARGLVERWRSHAASGEPLDVAAEMTRVTLEVVAETLLGGDVGEDGAIVARAFRDLNELVMQRTRALFVAPLWLKTPATRRLRTALADLDGAVYRIIARRRAERSTEERGDLLSLLMHARDAETGESMSDGQLRDEVCTMLLAGHETTSVALSWTFFLLAQHPEVEAGLREEIALLDGPPALGDLERLPRVRRALDEAMRIYPPVWATMRRAARDDVVDGYAIPRGAVVFVSSWIVHRSPSVWEEPLAFRPDRFVPEAAEARHRYAYFPFIGGPRQCIGNAFALTEAHLVLATVLQRYRLRLVPGHPVEPEPLMTLRPKHGVRMTLSVAEGNP